MTILNVNGKRHELDIDPDTPLLWVIRDHLGLTGTKYSCGIGECGACTVHMDGEAVKSCTITAAEAVGHRITTIEGASGPVADALMRQWEELDVPQCGFCQPGQIMQAADLLAKNPRPSDSDIDQAMSQVLCRCGSYQDVRRAIHQAAKEGPHGK